MQDYWDSHTVFEVWEILVDCFFIVDMLIVFLSEYIDTSNGETIRQPKMIAKHYRSNGFWVDFISSTPLFLRFIIDASTEEGSSAKDNLTSILIVFRLLKLLRVRRLSTLIANLNSPTDVKS